MGGHRGRPARPRRGRRRRPAADLAGARRSAPLAWRAAWPDLGVGPEVKVAQLLYNCPEYLETVYAAFKLRAVPLNVNYRYLADEIVHVLGNADAEVLVFHGSLGRVGWRRPGPRLPAPAAPRPGRRRQPRSSRAPTGTRTSWPASDARAPDRALRRRTSCCSTRAVRPGMPKGVMWRHEDLFGALAFSGYVSMGLEVPRARGRSRPDRRRAQRRRAQPGQPVRAAADARHRAVPRQSRRFVLGGTVVLLGRPALRRRRAAPASVERERVTQLSLVGDAFARPIVAALAAAEAAGRARTTCRPCNGSCRPGATFSGRQQAGADQPRSRTPPSWT